MIINLRFSEICVRKVVGASVSAIIVMLTRETAMLVGIALVLASTGVQAWRAARMDPIKAIRMD